MKLQNKVAIVTGGGGGIGRATCLRFAEEGASVLVSDMDGRRGEETVSLIREKGGTAEFFRVNVTVEDEVREMVQTAVRTFGKLDIMVNNAGISHGESKIVDVTKDDWDRVVDVCMTGVYLGMKHAIPELEKSGGGQIINTASVAGVKGQKLLSAYSAAKSGVITITKTTAAEYGKLGIRVNAIAPGIIDTAMADGWRNSHKWDALSQANALRRIGRPEEVANAFLFLASDDSSFITGETIAVDGGTLVGR